MRELDNYLSGSVNIESLIPHNALCTACGKNIFDKIQHREIALPHFEKQIFVGADYFCKDNAMQTYYAKGKKP